MLLAAVLPSPPRVAFRNSKTLKDKLVRSKLKTVKTVSPGTGICGRKNCHICNLLHQGDVFCSTNTGKEFKINFPFDCNSKNVVYLITCKVCRMQYVGSTTTKFRSRLNQCKSNFKLYGEGRRGFNQDKLLQHVFAMDHNGSYCDLMVQIIDFF